MVSSDSLEDLEDECDTATPDVADYTEGKENCNADGYDANDEFEDMKKSRFLLWFFLFHNNIKVIAERRS